MIPDYSFGPIARAQQISESLVSETLRYDIEKERGLDLSAETPAAKAEAVPAENSANSNERIIEMWQFSPEKGNVVFSCAVDCWGFGTLKFANIWSKKLGVNKAVLHKYMFEDYYFNNSTKKIYKCDPSDPSHVPMAVTLILEPIWRLYNICVTEKDTSKAAKMAERGVIDILGT